MAQNSKLGKNKKTNRRAKTVKKTKSRWFLTVAKKMNTAAWHPMKRMTYNTQADLKKSVNRKVTKGIKDKLYRSSILITTDHERLELKH